LKEEVPPVANQHFRRTLLYIYFVA